MIAASGSLSAISLIRYFRRRRDNLPSMGYLQMCSRCQGCGHAARCWTFEIDVPSYCGRAWKMLRGREMADPFYRLMARGMTSARSAMPTAPMAAWNPPAAPPVKGVR